MIRGAKAAALLERAQALSEIRRFFAERDVMEVQTPVLGAGTVTDPDVESIDVPGYGYLQTSPEYFMKRLLADGLPSIYSLGPVFRADEVGRRHRSEFTMLEWYRVGFDDAQLMEEVASLVDCMLGADEYQRISYAELVRGNLDDERAVLDLRFAEGCEALQGRVFVTDYPADQAVLARVKDNGWAARFELVIDGMEIANGYWELQDPAEHRRRFARDIEIRRERGLPLREPDEAFLQALEHGLPDCAGVALGLDRLLMLSLGETDIAKVQAFTPNL